MLKKAQSPPITPKPCHPNMTKVNGAGRLQLYAIQLSRDITVSVYNLYGWTNGNLNSEAATRTDSLIQAILSDVSLQPRGPVLIVGDLNGDPATFPSLKEALATNTFIDVGAQAHQWGSPSGDYTCRAHGTHQPTRRDYVFACPLAYGMIDGFQVDHQAGLPVHDPLLLRLKVSIGQRTTHNTLHKP